MISPEQAKKETVVLVHGTFAEPLEGEIRWCDNPSPSTNSSNFVTKLNAALERRGSIARCWAHCDSKTEIFNWSGANSWVDRTNAALHLAAYVNDLLVRGWRCHIVAHSHGGNILAEALPAIAARATRPSVPALTAITLGTPFLDTMSPLSRRARRLSMLAWSISWIAYSFVFGMTMLGAIGAYLIMHDHKDYFRFIPSLFVAPREQEDRDLLALELATDVFFLIILAILAMIVSYRKIRNRFQPSRVGGIDGWHVYWRRLRTSHPFLLALNSKHDEAWQVLHHVRSFENPLAPRRGLASFIWRQRLAIRRQRADIARIQGDSLFRDQTKHAKETIITIWALLPIAAVALLALANAVRAEIDMMKLDVAQLERGGEPDLLRIDSLTRVLFTSPEFRASMQEFANASQTVAVSRQDSRGALIEVYRREMESLRGLRMALPLVGLGALLVLVALATFVFGRGFYGAMFAPLRGLLSAASSVSGAIQDIGAYIVRRRAWRLIQELALGLDGYRFGLPKVERAPLFAPANCYMYEELSDAVVARAMLRRREWVAAHFGDVSEVFSRMAVTAADIQSLIQGVETDMSLVHGAYYSDDECIERIADWIAMTGVGGSGTSVFSEPTPT